MGNEPGYVWVEFRTPGFGFIDDVEFRLAGEERLIHFRSASRIGRSDFGVNRKRLQRIGDAFRTQQQNDSDRLSL